MHSSLRDTTRTIAEAMLAGSPERDGVIARMAAVLGEAPPWTHECADLALARQGEARIAWARPSRMCSWDTITGAPLIWFLVNTAAARAGTDE